MSAKIEKKKSRVPGAECRDFFSERKIRLGTRDEKRVKSEKVKVKKAISCQLSVFSLFFRSEKN